VSSRSGRGHVSGPLARYAEGFRQGLLGQGYTEGSAARQVHLMAHVSRWLAAQDLQPADLGECAALERLVAARRADGYAGFLSARALAPLLGYLRGLGVVAEPVLPEPRTPAEVLAGRFGEYLARERCLAAESIRSYLGVARRFMADAAVGDRGAGDLTPAAVTGFVRRECGRRGGDREGPAVAASFPLPGRADHRAAGRRGAVRSRLAARRAAPDRHPGGPGPADGQL